MPCSSVSAPGQGHGTSGRAALPAAARGRRLGCRSHAAVRLKPGWVAWWLQGPRRWRDDVRCPDFGSIPIRIMVSCLWVDCSPGDAPGTIHRGNEGGARPAAGGSAADAGIAEASGATADETAPERYGRALPIPASDYNAREGRAVFLHYCASCHGLRIAICASPRADHSRGGDRIDPCRRAKASVAHRAR